ncbi:MAG: hypothetical protein ACYDCO_07165 [Armatimonadota bacterium]
MLSTLPTVKELQAFPSARWCAAEPRKVSHVTAAREVALRDGTQGEFTIINTRVPAFRQTAFKVYQWGNNLLIAAALGKCEPGEGLEIFFDPYHDHAGYIQFVIDANGAQTFTHLPYMEAHSSDFRLIRLLEHHWETDASVNVVGVKEPGNWLFARFALDDIFRAGASCGFNVARCIPSLNEPGTWNHAVGTLLQDATGFGHLYRELPREVTLAEARLDGDRLRCAGEMPEGAGLVMVLADPQDERRQIPLTVDGAHWQGEVQLPANRPGRYRLYPALDEGLCEPGFFHFDLAPADPKAFSICMTYDFPDDARANYFTPERLEAQIDQLVDTGVSRVYWIEYPPYRAFPSFWRSVSDEKFVVESYRRCGDMLTKAAEISKAKGLEFIAVYKPFDIGGFHIEGGQMTDNPAKDGLMLDVDNHVLCNMPEIAAHPEWSMAANPAWAQTAEFPITRLRIYSNTPIPAAEAENFTLWVSEDNHDYAPYDGPLAFAQGQAKLPHCRWTPAGKKREPGTRTQWYLEFSGLKLDAPFLAIGTTLDPNCVNQRFLFAEALGRDGREAPVLLTLGSLQRGFTFGHKWSWENYTEDVVDAFAWRGGALGLAFAERPALPALLEPACRPAHKVWTKQVERILRAGVDGIDIRTLCQHHTCLSWLVYAFAEPVRKEFRKRFGRDVQATPEDYILVRQLRGECYTEFIRSASALTRQQGKKFAVHLEPGIEVPVQHSIRMQLVVEWQQWLEEGLLDEITLKYWSAQSSFVHEEILPRAKRENVPVYICDRNFSLTTARAPELAEALIMDAYRAGFAGMNWYETNSYYMLNPEGYSVPFGNSDYAVRRASHILSGG